MLILKGYLVHQAKGKNQDGQPLLFTEYAKSYRTQNDAVSALNNKTISMNTMLKDEYQRLIKLPPKVLKAVRRINESRNELHFLESLTMDHGNQITDELNAIREFVSKVKNIKEKYPLVLSKQLIELPQQSK